MHEIARKSTVIFLHQLFYQREKNEARGAKLGDYDLVDLFAQIICCFLKYMKADHEKVY